MDGSVARLVIRQGPASQPEYQLGSATMTIGRESSNEIVLNDPEISRRHARITFQNGRYMVEDLGSTNGTYVNGRRITSATPLNNNDTIDISDTVKMTYYGPGDYADATMIEPYDQVDTPTVGRYGQADQTAIEVPGQAPPPPLKAAQPHLAQPWAEPAQVAPVQQPPAGFGRPQTAPQSSGRSPRRLVAGCGCLVLLIIVACAASLFLLDAYAPDFFYCGPLQPLFETFGFALSCA